MNFKDVKRILDLVNLRKFPTSKEMGFPFKITIFVKLYFFDCITIKQAYSEHLYEHHVANHKPKKYLSSLQKAPNPYHPLSQPLHQA